MFTMSECMFTIRTLLELPHTVSEHRLMPAGESAAFGVTTGEGALLEDTTTRAR